MSVRRLGELLDVEHDDRGVGDRLAEYRLGVGSERRVEFFFGTERVDERELHAHLLHRDGKQVVSAAVYRRTRNDVISRGSDVEYREEVCRLTRRRQHRRGAALELGDLSRYVVVGRVLKSAVKISRLLEVEQFCHILAGVVFERSALYYRRLPGLAVFGDVTPVYASGFNFFHIFLLSPCGTKFYPL